MANPARPSPPGRRVPRQNTGAKAPYLLAVLCMLQICLLLTVGVARIAELLDSSYAGPSDGVVVWLVLGLLLVDIVFALRIIQKSRRDKAQADTQRELIGQMQELNTQIRAQRHDFLNHMQIVYGLLDMGATEDARNYLRKTFGDLDQLNAFIRTEDLAVNALLKAKSNDAARRGVMFSVRANTRLSHLPLSSWEFCRVLGNLIDNALYEAASRPEKSVWIALEEDISHYLITVKNTGLPLDDETMKRLFEPGFTTKKEQGEGMGLYIVHEAVKSCRGEITVQSQDSALSKDGVTSVTAFTVRLPKKLDAHKEK